MSDRRYLVSFSVTSRICRKDEARKEGFTVFPLYQARHHDGTFDSSEASVRYGIEHLDTWEDFITWVKAHPIGEELVEA